MITKIDKNAVRLRRHDRVRKSVSGTAETPRMSVYRSTNNIYVQLIDDVNGVTLASASTLEKTVKGQIAGKTKKEAAKSSANSRANAPKKKGSKQSCSTEAVTSTPDAYSRLQTAHVKPG